MKPSRFTLTSPILFLASFSAWGCTSTETGNPTTDPPGNGSPIEGSPVELHFGLRGPVGGMGMPNPGVPQAKLTALWLQVAEVDFITCTGKTLSTGGLVTDENLTTSQQLTVLVPSETICAMVVRTSPLTTSSGSSLPEGAVGQGAALEGTDPGEVPFSAVLAQRITSVLTPVSPGLTLKDAIDLELKIEDAVLLDALFGAPASLPTVPSNAYNEDNAPELTNELATRLGRAFSLERMVGETREVLATASASWSDVGDLLCASECALQDRSACSTAPCDVEACHSRLLDPLCGEAFQSALQCRVSLSPNEYTCADGVASVTTTHCALPDANYSDCGD